ncbi:hypothetical protein [Rhizobium leguminosarum]|nr:hypothetical protein [Rhizobium leguminosarum]MBP2444112.1 hypothetical protein [Rhizobium leguminosarum]
MMRFAPSRDFYIPKGSVKIADKAGDGLVYIYRPCRLEAGILAKLKNG